MDESKQKEITVFNKAISRNPPPNLNTPPKTLFSQPSPSLEDVARIREDEEIARQRGVYVRSGTGSANGFDYENVTLDPLYATTILDPLAEKLKMFKAQPKLLDIGAGKGEVGTHMRKRKIITLNTDINPSGLKGSSSALIATSWRLPFGNSTFEGIHSKDMIGHIKPEYRDPLFAEISRVLVPNGLVIVCSALVMGSFHAQYYLNPKDLITIARNHRLLLTHGNEYKTPVDSKDWYPAGTKHTVLEFIKM